MILSSSAPRLGIVDLLGMLRIGEDRRPPVIKNVVAEPRSAGEGDIETKKVLQLFAFRQTVAIMAHPRRKDYFEAYFAGQTGYSYKLGLTFFFILDRYKEEGLANTDLDRINSLLADMKEACKSLRRMSVIRELENTGSGPFIQAITLPYLPAPINYQNRDMQFKDEVETIARSAFEAFPEHQRSFALDCVRALCNAIDPDRILIPEELILWDNKVMLLSKYVMELGGQ